MLTIGEIRERVEGAAVTDSLSFIMLKLFSHCPVMLH
jgi:hypothetical protein